MEPVAQLEVAPSGTTTSNIGGGIFTLRYTSSDFGAFPPHPVSAHQGDPHVQLSFSHSPQPDGTTLLNIMLLNPNGFAPHNNAMLANVQNGGSLFRSLGFAVLLNGGIDITDANWQDKIQLISGNYIDLGGAPIPELTSTVTKTY
jgi:hypothetical protein